MDDTIEDTDAIRSEHTDIQGAKAGDEPADSRKAESELACLGAQEAAEFIRRDSRSGELTRLEVFANEPFLFSEQEQAQAMDDLAHDEAYVDIVRTLDERNGTQYLHSTTFLTVAYAKHTIRARANDPAYLIVETVRENSEIYPKPTSLEFFEFEPFGLAFDDVLTYANAILADEACPDIKSVKVTNDMVYLYSDTFLSEGQAQAMAQWVEVDMHLDSNK